MDEPIAIHGSQCRREEWSRPPEPLPAECGIMVQPSRAATVCEFDQARVPSRVMQAGLRPRILNIRNMPSRPLSLLTPKSPCEDRDGARRTPQVDPPSLAVAAPYLCRWWLRRQETDDAPGKDRPVDARNHQAIRHGKGLRSPAAPLARCLIALHTSSQIRRVVTAGSWLFARSARTDRRTMRLEAGLAMSSARSGRCWPQDPTVSGNGPCDPHCRRDASRAAPWDTRVLRSDR